MDGYWTASSEEGGWDMSVSHMFLATILLLLIGVSFVACGRGGERRYSATGKDGSAVVETKTETRVETNKDDPKPMEKVVKTDAQWKRELSPQQYRIMRQKGTEPAFTGKYWNCKTDGIYTCAGCGLELFDSETKYESGCGWPSFWAPITKKHVATSEDRSMGMTRTEILCPRCGAHLGHVFGDGPEPTGQRYCVNSASLDMVERKDIPKKVKTSADK
jgi:peptide-methionine (R)-S-oxide reductase